jgi:hypothetical protein
MLYNIIITVLLIIHTALCLLVGFYSGEKHTHREAYENGLMTIERVGDKRNYRWIETHKLGYDYNE